MSDTDFCKHELDPRTCSICKHGPTLRSRDPELTVTTCTECPAEIIWTKTENDRSMPIDAEPNGRTGRFRIEHFEEGMPVVHYVRNSELESNMSQLYTSHLDTCPERGSHADSRY